MYRVMQELRVNIMHGTLSNASHARVRPKKQQQPVLCVNPTIL